MGAGVGTEKGRERCAPPNSLPLGKSFTNLVFSQVEMKVN